MRTRKVNISFSFKIVDFKEYRHEWYHWWRLRFMRILYHGIWCKITKRHRWEMHHLPHWRRCKRCDYRELDHGENFGAKWGPEDWQPTTYGTPEWDKV